MTSGSFCDADEEAEIVEHWLQPFDLYEALGVPRSDKTNADRIRSAFCKLSYRYYPKGENDSDERF